MKENPLVSIVILNWNGLEDTKLCLEHTGQQTYPNTEIIVVDNGSVDGSVDYLRSVKNIKLIENPKNLGFTGGHITGYKASAGEYILLLNNDAVMDNDYVKNAVAIMQRDETIGAVGGRAYLWDDENKLFDTTNDFYAYQNINPITAEGIFERTDYGVLQEVNNVSGSCVLVRRSVIEKVGYLHEPFFAYFEESDLFARMKRAGYKVIYSPDLAIWHANAKSSKRQSSTFSLHMMMRNRFLFAVRNFDAWSLRRFLKFYLKMGVLSTIKACLPITSRPIQKAYAKAFFYNLLHGWRALTERSQLKKTLGASNYSARIVREQTGISVVAVCDSIEQLENYKKLAANLTPIDELLIMSKNPATAKSFSELKHKPFNLRLCVDRQYFDTPSENLGTICAKNDWILLADADNPGAQDDLNHLSSNLYFAKRRGKKMTILTDSSLKHSFNKFLRGNYSRQLLLARDLLIDFGGLDKKPPLDDAKRELIAYSYVANAYYGVKLPSLKSVLGPSSQALADHELHKKLSSMFHHVLKGNKKPSLLEKLAAKNYRFHQFRNVFIWLFTPRIPTRLKLGRIKNTLLFVFTFKRQDLATELKHMRNEIVMYRSPYDLAAAKKDEKIKLDRLIENPSNTPVFVILRDRYESLAQLLKWLESQKLKKIIFIDNDSRLPQLVDFLSKTDYQVLELGRNMTHKAPWTAGIIKVLCPEDFYVITDPDIIPTVTQKDALKHFYEVHKQFPQYMKVGFGLKIDDLPDEYPLKNEVIKWESQFWKNKLIEGVYEAGVDTTFAVYKPRTYQYMLNPSIRLGEPFVARHLPWYHRTDNLSDEEIFYRLRADKDVSSWNRDHLPERYKKELAKHR